MRSERRWRNLSRRAVLTAVMFLLLGILCGCGASGPETTPQLTPATPVESQLQETVNAAEPENDNSEEGIMNRNLTLAINGEALSVTWEDNASVEALKELVSSGAVTVQMSKYGGFEQVGPLGASLPRDDVQTTTGPGDIVLYSGNQIVVFYGSNSWAYTRLGHIDGKTVQELARLLGNGDVTVTIVMEG